MTTARQFLEECFSKHEQKHQLKRFYVYRMTQGLDKRFILDLSKIRVSLLPLGQVFSEILNYLKYFVKNEIDIDLNYNFVNYLRAKKSMDFIRNQVWSFLYSLEMYKESYEEIWIQTSILCSPDGCVEFLNFYMLIRRIILQVTQKSKCTILDDIRLNYQQLNRIFNQVFGAKTAQKIHLIKNFQNNQKSSSVLSSFLVDWVNQRKKLRNVQRYNQKNHKSKSIKLNKQTRTMSSSAIQKSAKNLKKSRSQLKLTKKAKLQKKQQFYQKEEIYLMKKKEETQQQMDRVRVIHQDLLSEFNHLHHIGQKLYKQFFDMYYSLKLKTKRADKLPVTEKDLKMMKSFLKFKKQRGSPVDQKNLINPLYEIIQCDLKNNQYNNMILLWLISCVSCNLLFLKKSQQKEFGLDKIQYSLAPFGKYPYGRELYGYLHYQSDNGCSSFDIKTALKGNEFPFMLLMDEGSCAIKLQAFNAEMASAKLLVIIRDKSTEENVFKHNHNIMNLVVEIPTVTISKEQGEKLKGMIRKEGDLLMKFQMPIPQRNEVQIDLYMILEEESIYKFLKNIKEHMFQLGKSVKLSFFLDLPLNPKNIKDQARIQMMMNCMPQDYIYDYFDLYYDQCISKANYASSCFEEHVESLGSVVQSTFKNCLKIHQDDLMEISHQIKNQNTSMTTSHIMINNSTYHGSLRPENVFEAICGAFLSSPDSCLFLNNKYSVLLKYNQYKEQRHQKKMMIYLINVVIIILLLCIAAITLHFIYKKIYERILAEKVQVIVRDYVSKYDSITSNE